MLNQRARFYIWVFYVCANFGEINRVLRPWVYVQTDRQAHRRKSLL